MAKDLLVRGFDDKTHSELGQIAGKMGVSLNSIIKDAVDKWISNNSKVIKKHELIIYSDNESLKKFLKSINRLVQKDDIYQVCCGPQEHVGMKFLKKQGWFNGTVEPYKQFLTSPNTYGKKVLEKVGKNIDRQQLMVLAFLTGDLAEKLSVKKSADFCQWYDEQNVQGITHCVAPAKSIFSGNLDDILKLFNTHDQVYIVTEDSLYKIHTTKESIHKLFLN